MLLTKKKKKKIRIKTLLCRKALKGRMKQEHKCCRSLENISELNEWKILMPVIMPRYWQDNTAWIGCKRENKFYFLRESQQNEFLLFENDCATIEMTKKGEKKNNNSQLRWIHYNYEAAVGCIIKSTKFLWRSESVL